MKNKILLGAMMVAACTFSIHVKAQLEVQTSGDVVISKNINISKCAAINGADFSTTKSLNVKAPSLGAGASAWGIYSSVKQSHPLIVTSGIGIGVYGCTLPYSGMSSLNLPEQQRPSSSPFYAGVVGQSSSWVGVYGTTSNSLPNAWTEGNYAGYFEGNVNVNGTLIADHVAKLSDQRFMENISRLSSRNNEDIISNLQPVSFTLRKDSARLDSKKSNAVHYGFIAQEMQEIVPELVSEDGAGYLSINYMDLIPILVQKVQELSAEVEELKKRNK